MKNPENWFILDGTASLPVSVMREIGEIANQVFTRDQSSGWEYGFFISDEGERYFGRKSSENFWASSGVQMTDNKQFLNRSFESLSVFCSAILKVLASDLFPQIVFTGSIPTIPSCEVEIANLSEAICEEYVRRVQVSQMASRPALPSIKAPREWDFRA